MTSLSLSIPSSSLSQNCVYDVFVSFHGKDVRRSILSHILKELRSKGINPFIDDEIKRGKFIGPELKRAIQGSRIAIVLLSKRYASSSWCLDELVEIMKCKKELGQTVITIFYEVDPTDIKKQTGDFGNVFRKTCASKKTVVIRKWSQALAAVATIAGYHSRTWVNDAVMIEKITADIFNMLFDSTPSSYFDRFIGMGAHIERMEPLLRLDLEEVRMIGIWGPPGIGKTTIARFLFSQLSNRYQLSVFMESIKERYTIPACSDDYIATSHLQQLFLSQITSQKDFKIPYPGVAQDMLKDKKVLVVLDDVNHSVQLDAMAENNQWFGPESRIIITTQDRRLLRAHGITHIYKVKYPIDKEALQMFCMYAFKQKFPYDGFEELSREVVKLSGNLPLGLKVIGSYFRGMSTKQEWTMALPRLRDHLDGNIESILKFSYNALFDKDKDLFLHIACFFNHQYMEKVEAYLVESFRNVRQGLHFLVDKSLISIDHGIIKMHDLLAQFGKEIVRKQFDREPGKRQFLVDAEDICEVLADDTTTTRSVIGINYNVLSRDQKLSTISEKAIKGMSNLQFLRVKCGNPYITSMPECPKLRLLEWDCSSMTCLPLTVDLESLVELKMVESKLEKLWEGDKQLRNLKWMDLSFSRELMELPNLSTAINLQELKLNGCSSLVKLGPWLKECSRLRRLELNGMRKLVSISELPDSLLFLDAGYCESLERLDCSFCNPDFLNFEYCFKLNQEARDLIIQTSTRYCVVLPGVEVPDYFTNRAFGNSVTVKLNQKPLRTSTKFHACISVGDVDFYARSRIEWSIKSNQNDRNINAEYIRLMSVQSDHLYIFELEAEEVTSTELDFEFEIVSSDFEEDAEISKCGIVQLFEGRENPDLRKYR